MSSANRPRLGRGLNALILPREPHVDSAPSVAVMDAATPIPPAEAHDLNPTHRVQDIPLVLIDPNPHQPRESMDQVVLDELAASIRVHGVLQPVLVLRVQDRYQLVAGHRRAAAAKSAGLQTIPAIVRSDSSPERQSEWALIENIQRQDLNPMERAKAYRTYIDQFHLTHSQAAQQLGEDRATVSNFLRLLDLPQFVQAVLRENKISAGHAKVLAGIDSPERQESLAKAVVDQGLSVRQLEQLAAAGADPHVGSTVSEHTRRLKSAHILELEQELSRKLGAKLRIFPSRKKGKGKIVIHYYSLDNFDGIAAKLSQ
ncbi:MAG TPA: ParB/RepB/Spo0J family partition protein [Phycisphaerae bacterium]|nr:ParB/RepB/Spo0J family partition protein [Phycisphaerae bacterium]